MAVEDIGSVSMGTNDKTTTYKTIDVIQSENDQRKYKYVILENNIKVLLISDPTSEKSAASVDVHVGHSSDPDAVPGIAHFCEHMLFLGTEKYPDEAEFSQFLSQNGGSSNACTSAEHTTYHFDIKSEALQPALDRFSQFFLSPLFNADSTDRELNAINSEHQKNILADIWRMNYIDKATSKPGHVFQKFGTGNLETLKTIPEQKNIDIRELLLQFHTKYYSSNIITVAVLGIESVENLEQMVVPLFKNVKNKETVVPSYEDIPYSENELGVMVKIPTIKEMKKLELKFPLPDYHKYYTSKPGEYVSHLIGHEGEGSLLSLLKRKAWVNSLWAGSHRVLTGFEFFTVSMELTEEGLNYTNDIIGIVFQFINMMQKEEPLEWVCDELRMLHEITFRFKDKEQPQRYVKALSHDMQIYPPEDILYGPYRLESFSPKLITDLVNHLNPKNFRCFLASQTFEGKTDQKVKYYDASYTLERIPNEQIEKWVNIGYHPELHIPKKNLFIPSSLEVVVPREEKAVKDVPVLIKDTEIIRVWYKADDKFFLPKACMNIHVSSPHASITPHALNRLSMYIRLVRDELVEFAYDAELAGIEYRINWSYSGISLQISGFNSKQSILLKKILELLTNLEIKQERFNVNKEQLEESLRNVELRQPYIQMEGLKSYLITETVWNHEERLQYMKDLTMDSLKDFIHELWKDIYIECLLCGNLLLDDAKEIYSTIEKLLIEDNHAKAMLPVQHIIPREYQLASEPSYLYEKRSKVHTNSCVQIYLQIGLQATRSNVLSELFTQMIQAPFFDVLRTKEQLGYIVYSGLSRTSSVQGISAIIQSDKPPSSLDDRIDSFLESLEETLKTMSDDQFRDYVEALCVRKLEKPKRLVSEVNKYWVEILVKQYHFVRDECEVEELRKLTKEDVYQFFKTYIDPSSKDRKKIAIVFLGKDAASLLEDKIANEKSWKPIVDVLEFKSTLPLYQHVSPYNNVPLLSTTKSKL